MSFFYRVFHTAPLNPDYGGGETAPPRMEEGMGNGGAGENVGSERRAKWWRKWLACCK